MDSYSLQFGQEHFASSSSSTHFVVCSLTDGQQRKSLWEEMGAGNARQCFINMDLASSTRLSYAFHSPFHHPRKKYWAMGNAGQCVRLPKYSWINSKASIRWVGQATKVLWVCSPGSIYEEGGSGLQVGEVRSLGGNFPNLSLRGAVPCPPSLKSSPYMHTSAHHTHSGDLG